MYQEQWSAEMAPSNQLLLLSSLCPSVWFLEQLRPDSMAVVNLYIQPLTGQQAEVHERQDLCRAWAGRWDSYGPETRPAWFIEITPTGLMVRE